MELESAQLHLGDDRNRIPEDCHGRIDKKTNDTITQKASSGATVVIKAMRRGASRATTERRAPSEATTLVVSKWRAACEKAELVLWCSVESLSWRVLALSSPTNEWVECSVRLSG